MADWCEVLDLAQGDYVFKEVVSKIALMMPNFQPEHLFDLQNLSRLPIDKLSLITNGFVHHILSLHFLRVSDKRHNSKSSHDRMKFIGRASNRRGSKQCIYFTRGHLVELMSILFGIKDLKVSVVVSVWSKLHKKYSQCRSDMSREFTDDELFSIQNTLIGHDDTTSHRPIRAGAGKKVSCQVIAQSISCSSSVKSAQRATTSSSTRESEQFVNKAAQTHHTYKKFKFSPISSRATYSPRNKVLSCALAKSKKRVQELEAECKVLLENMNVLIVKKDSLTSQVEFLTQGISEANSEIQSLKTKHQKLLNEHLCASDELNTLKDMKDDISKVNEAADDPDFVSKVDKLEHAVLNGTDEIVNKHDPEKMAEIKMRFGRKGINPVIVTAIIILRHVGGIASGKTMKTLVLLGNLVFGQKWMLGSDVSNSKTRQRAIVPENNSSVESTNVGVAGKSTRVSHPITDMTAPTQTYIRNCERNVLAPQALRSTAQEMKSEFTESVTLMTDHCSINRSKAQTVGVVTTIKDPESGQRTSHYRNIGIDTVVRTDTDATFRTVVNSLRNVAVLDADSSEASDIHASMNSSTEKMKFMVADGASEMEPMADRVSDLKKSMGHNDGLSYIHCNAHVSPAFDTAIDTSLSNVEKMLEIVDNIVREFNSTFFKKSHSCILTTLRALFNLLGSSLVNNADWNMKREFTMYLDARDQPTDTFFDPSITRFGKESEMCFILTYNFSNVTDFLNNVHMDNRIFKACGIYVKCPFFREIVTSISLVFYHIYAPFLAGVGAETQFGYRVLTHNDLLMFYPKLIEELKRLTSDPSPLLVEDRLEYLTEFPKLCIIKKVVYRNMASKIFADMNTLICEGSLDSDIMKGILKLVCEEFFIVLDRQVVKYYCGPDSIVGNACAQNPELMNGIPITSLSCEHSVGTLRQQFRRAPTALMQTHARSQIIRTSPWFQKLVKSQVSPHDVGEVVKWAKKSKTVKLYQKHKMDDEARLKQDKQAALRQLQLKKVKAVKTTNQLITAVKEHGGPCQTPSDVDKLCKSYKYDPKFLTKALWNEIKFQKLVVHSDFIVSDPSLYLSKKLNKGTNKFEEVPLECREKNLKSILSGYSLGEERAYAKLPTETFLKRVDEKHQHMKTFPHRSEPEVEEEPLSIDLDAEFYLRLPSLQYVAVYYDDEGCTQKWFPGQIAKVNLSADCEECKNFALPECNQDYMHCFDVKFLSISKGKTKVSKTTASSGNAYEWVFNDEATYHVPVCQIIACEVKLIPTSAIVVGSAAANSSRKRTARSSLSFKVDNSSSIDDALQFNILYMLKNN